MSACLQHRGPDSSGSWVDEAAGVAFGFRRLAILDLRPTGEQPMVSADGRWVVVFNGEIYNHPDLRRDLEGRGIAFRGSSDTEVLVESIARWGLESTLQRADAMFAMAAWDRRDRELHLAVDRFGEKPLYYGWCSQRLLFASELDALRTQPGFDRTVDRAALVDLLAVGYVGGSRSIYASVSKVEPGTWLTLRRGAEPGATLVARPWWSAMTAAIEAHSGPAREGDQEQALHDALRMSTSRRMVADVPVGAFLSGGLDSSLIVALMQESASAPVRTFTVGFDRPDYDESPHAREVARVLGTDHTEARLSISEASDLVPRMPELFDEPLGDASVLPTYLVSRMARRDVTVAIAGDGGDELFGGYGRHVAHRLVARLGVLPPPLRNLLARAAQSLGPRQWERVVGVLGPGLRTRVGQARLPEKLEKLAAVIDNPHPDVLFDRLSSIWPDAPSVVVGMEAEGRALGMLPAGMDPSERAMLADTLEYLPGDLLVKTDRSSMAVSLETRLPFLSPDVYSVAWAMPSELRAGTGVGKRVVRDLLRRYLPAELIDRPKMGFDVPVSDWLRGELRGWAEDLLARERLRSEGFLAVDPIREAWAEHLSGRRDHGRRLWVVCVFQAWLEHSESIRTRH